MLLVLYPNTAFGTIGAIFAIFAAFTGGDFYSTLITFGFNGFGDCGFDLVSDFFLSDEPHENRFNIASFKFVSTSTFFSSVFTSSFFSGVFYNSSSTAFSGDCFLSGDSFCGVLSLLLLLPST